MFLEIEQKVASLSALGQAADQQQQQDELGAVGSQQEAAELLSSKLELLKSNLVVFQQLLMDKQVEERTIIHKEPQEQVPYIWSVLLDISQSCLVSCLKSLPILGV